MADEAVRIGIAVDYSEVDGIGDYVKKVIDGIDIDPLKIDLDKDYLKGQVSQIEAMFKDIGKVQIDTSKLDFKQQVSGVKGYAAGLQQASKQAANLVAQLNKASSNKFGLTGTNAAGTSITGRDLMLNDDDIGALSKAAEDKKRILSEDMKAIREYYQAVEKVSRNGAKGIEFNNQTGMFEATSDTMRGQVQYLNSVVDKFNAVMDAYKDAGVGAANAIAKVNTAIAEKSSAAIEQKQNSLAEQDNSAFVKDAKQRIKTMNDLQAQINAANKASPGAIYQDDNGNYQSDITALKALCDEANRAKASVAALNQEIADQKSQGTELPKESIDAVTTYKSRSDATSQAKAEIQRQVESQKALVESQKASYQEAIDVINEYNKRRNDALNSGGKVTFDESQGKWVGDQMPELTQQLNEAAAAYDKLSESQSRNNMSAEQSADITKRLTESEAAYARAQEKVNIKTSEKNTKSYIDSLKELNNLYTKVASGEQKWTKAREGKSKEQYIGLSTMKKEMSAYMKSIVSQGEISDPADYMNRMNTWKKNFEQYRSGIEAAGENTQSFGSKLKGVFSNLTSYMSVAQILMKVTQGLKQMANAAAEVETAMNRIQIVTGASDSQMKTFLETTTTMAKELGQSVTDVAESIETFSRLGYNLSDSSTLAKFANIMANVSDADVKESTTGITSILKGYGLDPSDAEHVSDVLIEVGQKYAISASELMEAFQRGGAALSASGTDFEKSAALFAATNASLQNAATTGTLWKTKILLSLRIEICA